MLKDFWGRCIKNFIRITIPTLVALITIFSFFSTEFEETIKTLGIFGAILVCLLFFSLTLLYECNRMIKVVDIIDKELSQVEHSNERIIYHIYNSYNTNKRLNIKNSKNSDKINNSILFKCKEKDCFSNKYLKVKDLQSDALQEICYVLCGTGFTILSNFITFPEIYPLMCDLPKSMNDLDIKTLRENIESDYLYNVLIDFTGIINGNILLCFSCEFRNVINEVFKKNYLKYLTANNCNYYINSYIYELGNVFSGSCLTSLAAFLNLKYSTLRIRKISVNENINYLKLNNGSVNISVTNLSGFNIKGEYLFTSYIMFNRDNVENLLNRVGV